MWCGMGRKDGPLQAERMIHNEGRALSLRHQSA
jgi:hypothetical protein